MTQHWHRKDTERYGPLKTWFYIASTLPAPYLYFLQTSRWRFQASESAMADTDPQKAPWIFRGGCWHIDHESSANNLPSLLITRSIWYEMIWNNGIYNGVYNGFRSDYKMISLERWRWYLNYHELHGGFSVRRLKISAIFLARLGRPNTSTTARRWTKPSRTSRMPITASSKTKMTIWTTRSLVPSVILSVGKSWKMPRMGKTWMNKGCTGLS